MYYAGGVKMRLGLTGKPGRAWVGAWLQGGGDVVGLVLICITIFVILVKFGLHNTAALVCPYVVCLS